MIEGMIILTICTDNEGKTTYQISNRPNSKEELLELSNHLGYVLGILETLEPIVIH